MTNTSLEVIGYVRCDYKEKFGIPRQSGLTDCATAFIEMLPPYNQAEAFRGLDGFSHIWLLWDFSRAHKNGFTATVKPPKLGGNQRMGVFATRSPFRPNNIGLSSVKLLDIIYNEETGCVHGLVVSGADILDGTPVYDIKPYLPGNIDFILITHAHIDHSGLLPLLVRNGFRGRIYATKPTAKLCSIMLRDSAHIQEFEAEWKNRKGKRSGAEPVEPMYTIQDAEAAVRLFRGVEYGKKTELAPGLEIEFVDVGHLLGSSSIEIWVTENGTTTKLVFSGDIGNQNQPLIKDPAYITDADYVVILDAGRIVAEGTPLALKNAYTGDFITLYGKSEQDVAALELPCECIRDAVRVAVPDTAAATRLILAHPEMFTDYEITKGRMDDVFLAVTGKKLNGGGAE